MEDTRKEWKIKQRGAGADFSETIFADDFKVIGGELYFYNLKEGDEEEEAVKVYNSNYWLCFERLLGTHKKDTR